MKPTLKKELEASLELMNVANRMGISKHEILDRSSVDGIFGLLRVIIGCKENYQMSHGEIMTILGLDRPTYTRLLKECC
jgi:hypothetical protein